MSFLSYRLAQGWPTSQRLRATCFLCYCKGPHQTHSHCYRLFQFFVFWRQDFNHVTEAFLNKIPVIVRLFSSCYVPSNLIRCKRYGLCKLVLRYFFEKLCLLFCLTFQGVYLLLAKFRTFWEVLVDVSME